MVQLDLQRFAEGQDAGGMNAGGGDVTGGADSSAGVSGQAAADQAQGQAGGVSFASQAAYEEAVGQRIQQAIQQRFKNQKDLQGQLDSYAPIMQALGMKYGLDASNVQEIAKRLTDDDSLYAEEAARQGVTPPMLKYIKQLEFENNRLHRVEQESQEDLQMRQHYETLVRQSEELKKVIPGFDLQRELQNERFARMTSPGVGISVRDAYNAIHFDEIQRAGMQYAAQQAGQRIAASVRSGASRPMENGLQSQQPVNMAIDIKHMDKKTREEYARRIRNGETIDFVNRI